MGRILKKIILPFFIKKTQTNIYIQLLKGLYFQFLQHGREEGYNTRCKAVKGGESEARAVCSLSGYT